MSKNVNVLADGLAFPEGPAFDPSGDLWCVELQGGCLTRWRDDEIRRFETGGAPNGSTVDRTGRLWFCDSGEGFNAIRRLTPATGLVENVCDSIEGQPLNRPNDLAFDPAGNCLFTCPNYTPDQPPGYVCCISPDGRASVIGRPFEFCNGLALTDAGQTLVVAETQTNRLWKGTWRARDCRWLDPSPWGDVGQPGQPGGPDGMAFGADGLLYVAVYGSGQIRVVAPDGQVTRAYDLPGANPTNCAFDPSGKLGLVVTEAEKGLLLSLPDLGPGQPLFAAAWP